MFIALCFACILQDSVFGTQKRKPKQALLLASSQTLHDQAEEDGGVDNINPLEDSLLLQSTTTNATDMQTNMSPEASVHQKIFHASEKMVQSPIKSYKEETGE